jgi:hypothetical protein
MLHALPGWINDTLYKCAALLDPAAAAATYLCIKARSTRAWDCDSVSAASLSRDCAAQALTANASYQSSLSGGGHRARHSAAAPTVRIIGIGSASSHSTRAPIACPGIHK